MGVHTYLYIVKEMIMGYVCIKEYNGKNLASKNIAIPLGTKVERKGNYLYYNNTPICLYRSNIMREHFIWDDNLERRLQYHKDIFDENRSRSWTITVPRTDDRGKIIGIEKVAKYDRYTPAEVDYIQQHWPHLIVPGPALVFNDRFYHESNIEDLAKLARYCREMH